MPMEVGRKKAPLRGSWWDRVAPVPVRLQGDFEGFGASLGRFRRSFRADLFDFRGRLRNGCPRFESDRDFLDGLFSLLERCLKLGPVLTEAGIRLENDGCIEGSRPDLQR